ncbi:hypothetical protein AU476_15035 [Cupriavidus sp. UYMSc13B]|nr:hypothetical protein AU476_15035 [Cupriavidus sp. UYMSc13B]
METQLQALIGYFSANPGIALATVFAASMLEALAVIGTIIPGSSIVFISGVLIGLNVLNPWGTAALAVSGAILGDAFSYWLGHHYHERIRTILPIKSYPALIVRGQAYFAKNGAKSIFFGRFLGPVRALVPVVAGMSNLPARKFFTMNILSAFAWAAAHIIPGTLFGASLQLAGAISSRLVLLFIFIGIVLWIIGKVIRLAQRHGLPLIRLLRDHVAEHARVNSGFFWRIVLSLLDPTNADSKALLAAVILLVGSVWLFLGIVQDVIANDPLVQFDQTVYAVLQVLRTAWMNRVMVAVTELGGAAGAVPVVVAMALLLAYKRYWRTLCYWLAAAGVAEMLVGTLKITLGRVRPHNIYTGISQYSFPSGHVMLSIVVYGFMAILLARGRRSSVKLAIWLSAGAMIALIAFSRMYLGIHWFSDVVASLSLGLAWVALLSIVYTHRVFDQRVPVVATVTVVVITLSLVGTWYVPQHHSADIARYAYRPKPEMISMPDWKAEGWRGLPLARSELEGDIEEPFNAQWAATPAQVGAVLTSVGWQSPAPWSLETLFLWLLRRQPFSNCPSFRNWITAQLRT